MTQRRAARPGKPKLRRTLARVRSRAPAATQNAARFGLVGKGSVALDSMMREHFAGMTVEQAIQRGPAAWLDAGVTESIARQLFDEPTAKEARRRCQARYNVISRARRATIRRSRLPPPDDDAMADWMPRRPSPCKRAKST